MSSDASAVVEQAVADLAERLGVEPAQISVDRAVAATWRDGAIGCPREGMAYTQALVDGYLVELTANGETYAYHQGGSRPPFWCENPQAPYTTEG